jgi:hypothetical protein
VNGEFHAPVGLIFRKKSLNRRLAGLERRSGRFGGGSDLFLLLWRGERTFAVALEGRAIFCCCFGGESDLLLLLWRGERYFVVALEGGGIVWCSFGGESDLM